MKTAQIVVRTIAPTVPAYSVEFGTLDSEQGFAPFDDYQSWCVEHSTPLLHCVKFDDSLGTKAWIPASKFPLLHAAILQGFPDHSMSFYPGYVVYTIVLERDEN